MTPSLLGRIQTRILLLATVGLVWTLIVTPVLPRAAALPGESAIGQLYSTTLFALAVITVLGAVVWEPLYHLLQQYRWEKDWPILFSLLLGVPEGIVAFLIVDQVMMGGSTVVTPTTFWVLFVTTWVLVWLTAIGPLRMVLLRWRYRGGRVW